MTTIATGDYLRGWHDTGAFGFELVYARVIRVNRVTVTVIGEHEDKPKRIDKEFAERSVIKLDDWHPEIQLLTQRKGRDQ